jgi:hypothetical protein
MSQVAISGNASGTGTLTIAAPNTNSNYTLTLPTVTGTVLTNKTAGTVLQVVSTTKTDTFSTASTSYVDITGLTVSITPSSATSKIYIVLSISGSENAGWGYQLVRGSTAICIGDSGGGSRKQASGGVSVRDTNGIANGSVNFLDSPATTSATTYKVQMYVPSSTGYVNRTYGDVDASYTVRTASTITVMEIAA